MPSFISVRIGHLYKYSEKNFRIVPPRCGWHGIFLIVINSIIMGNLLYIIAVVLVIIWAIGFLGYHAGGIIHLLLVIAIVAVLLRVISGRKPL